jgi:uncharacterized protein (TIRG00374 family)
MTIERKSLHLAIGLGISALSLWLALRHVRYPLLFHALWKGHYGWLIPIVVLMNVMFLGRALFWKGTLSVTKKVGIGHLYSSIIVGYMANNLLPFRGGEMVRLLYTHRLEKISTAVLFSTIFLERFFDVIWLTLILFLYIFLHGAEGFAHKAAYLGAVMFGISFALLLVVHSRTFLVDLAKKVLVPDRKGWREKAAGGVEKALFGLSSLESPVVLARLFVVSGIVWGTGLEAGYFYLRIFDLDAQPVLMTVSFYLFTNLAFLLPSSPGAIGVIQFATVYAMRQFGVSDERAIALSVVYQLVPFLFTTLLGWMFIHRQHMSLFDRGNLKSGTV